MTGGCPGHCEVYSRIHGFCKLDGIGLTLPIVVTLINVSRHCQMSPGEELPLVENPDFGAPLKAGMVCLVLCHLSSTWNKQCADTVSLSNGIGGHFRLAGELLQNLLSLLLEVRGKCPVSGWKTP